MQLPRKPRKRRARLYAMLSYMTQSSNCQGDCVLLDKQPKIFVNLILSIALSFHLALDIAHVLVHVLICNERCMHDIQPSSQHRLLHVLLCVSIHLVDLGECSLPSSISFWVERSSRIDEGGVSFLSRIPIGSLVPEGCRNRTPSRKPTRKKHVHASACFFSHCCYCSQDKEPHWSS